MILNIIDFRNRYLDRILCQSDETGLIVSTMLPETNQNLPGEIKVLLQKYMTEANKQPYPIHITIEVNEWLNKEKAIKMLQHMQILVGEFFSEHNFSSPEYQLAIFEKNEFKLIDCKSMDTSSS